jgi:hypothetical protein
MGRLFIPRSVLAVLFGSLGLWLVCAMWVVPAMIESAYRGESWSFLNGMIRGQATHPVADYVLDWYGIATKLTLAGLLSGLGVWLGALVINRPALLQWIRIVFRAVAILTLNTLVLLACLEIAAIGVLRIGSVFSNPTEQLVGEGNPRETVSYYSSQDWAQRYWYEFRLTRTQRYHPYVGWRRAPFKGKTIEIDQNGIRVTPGADCRANSFKVFTFGESTMWGTGSPNWGTIPANLQRSLAQLRQGPVCVMNFAESAYVTTQDVIMLQMQLRSGNVPDVAVFYGISGDIGAALDTGRARVHANLDDIASRFQGRREPFTFVDWLRGTSAYSLIYQLVGKLTIANPQEKQLNPFEGVTNANREIDVARLSESIVQEYFGNYTIVSALAQKYGFKYLFVVPPVIVLGNKPLTSEEQEMKRSLESDIALDKLLTAVLQAIERESSNYPNLHSMVHVFDRYESLIWIDGGHVTPVGNEIIAEKMLDLMQVR